MQSPITIKLDQSQYHHFIDAIHSVSDEIMKKKVEPINLDQERIKKLEVKQEMLTKALDTLNRKFNDLSERMKDDVK